MQYSTAWAPFSLYFHLSITFFFLLFLSYLSIISRQFVFVSTFSTGRAWGPLPEVHAGVSPSHIMELRLECFGEAPTAGAAAGSAGAAGAAGAGPPQLILAALTSENALLVGGWVASSVLLMGALFRWLAVPDGREDACLSAGKPPCIVSPGGWVGSLGVGCKCFSGDWDAF